MERRGKDARPGGKSAGRPQPPRAAAPRAQEEEAFDSVEYFAIEVPPMAPFDSAGGLFGSVPAPPAVAGRAGAAALDPGLFGEEAAAPADGRPSPRKRGPGRPPKRKVRPTVEQHGIVEAPFDPQNRLELIYAAGPSSTPQGPSVFKALFAYLKNLHALKIHLRVTPTGLTFFMRSDTHPIRSLVQIHGDRMNHFYADASYWLNLNRTTFDGIFGSVDKTFDKVTFLYRHDDPDRFRVVFTDGDVGKECTYRPELATFDPDEDLYSIEAFTTPEAIETFRLDFTLTAKQFKKTVTDALGNSAENFTIEKMGEYPLRFTYSRVGELDYEETYRNPAKILLRSSVPPGGTFRKPVRLTNVKALAQAAITDKVRIMCREDTDLVFRSEIDGIIVSTFVSTT